MTKIQKLLVLIILSLSVYFIYQKTDNSNYQVLNISDNFSMDINKSKKYIDYYQKHLLKENKKVIINNNYSSNNQSIYNILSIIKNNSKIKAELLNADQIIINLGYNDLLYNIAIEDKMNEKRLNKVIKRINNNYNNLIKEIKRYYHKPIIVIGYYKVNINNKYIDQGIIKLNKVLKDNQDINYIDTYYLLNNKNKYFIKPNNNYINNKANYTISKKIISKTLEIS